MPRLDVPSLPAPGLAKAALLNHASIHSPLERPESSVEAVGVLHRRKAPALEVDVLNSLAKGVVDRGREARAAPLAAQLQAVVVAAENGLEHIGCGDRARKARTSRVDVGRSTAVQQRSLDYYTGV